MSHRFVVVGERLNRSGSAKFGSAAAGMGVERTYSASDEDEVTDAGAVPRGSGDPRSGMSRQITLRPDATSVRSPPLLSLEARRQRLRVSSKR